MHIVGKDGMKSDNDRVLEIVPQIMTANGMILSFPPAFYPFDGELIGLSRDYVIGHRYQGTIYAGGDLPAVNMSMCARLGLFYAVHEAPGTMAPRTLDEIRGEILMGALQRGNT